MEWHIDKDEVLRSLGYAGQAIDQELSGRIDALIGSVAAQCSPKSVTAVFGIDRTRSQPRPPAPPAVALVGTDLVLEGADIARHLEGAGACVLMACTLGAANDQNRLRTAAASPLDALIYDAASSALVEQVANREEARLVAEAARRGNCINGRYSPGYGDFPLSVQPDFLATLDATRRIGLTVTGESLLVPTKSITAVLGVFDHACKRVRRTCAECTCRDCCSIRASGGQCCGS